MISAIGSLTNTNIKVYPNPLQETFTISFDKEAAHQVMIYSTDLRLVFESNFKAGENAPNINMGSLSAGTYMLKVYEEGIEYTYKLVKQ